MKKIAFIIMLLPCVVSFGQRMSLGDINLIVGLSAGDVSVDRWHPYEFKNYKGIIYPNNFTYQVSLGIATQLTEKGLISFKLAYQHSGDVYENIETTNYYSPSDHRQHYFTAMPQYEWRWNRTYVETGPYLAYETQYNSIVHYPRGVVRASKWHGGISLGAGFHWPIKDAGSLKLGLQSTVGFLRYYNYSEQFEKNVDDRKYDHLKLMPTVLLSLQYDIRISKKD